MKSKNKAFIVVIKLNADKVFYAGIHEGEMSTTIREHCSWWRFRDYEEYEHWFSSREEALEYLANELQSLQMVGLKIDIEKGE